MPPMEESARGQKALYYELTGFDNYGEPTVAEPVQLAVRWVNKTADGLDAQGLKIRADATVITDTRLLMGSLVWLGGFEDLPGTGLVPEKDVMYVIGVNETTDIRNRNTRRKYLLKRWKTTLPGA